MKYEDIIKVKKNYNKNERFKIEEFVLKLLSKFYRTNKIVFEYSLYAHFVEYLKYICLKIYYKNLNVYVKDKIIFKAYASLAENLNMTSSVDYNNKVINLKKEFILTHEEQQKILKDEIAKSNQMIKRMYKSYHFIVTSQKNRKLFKTATANYMYYLIIYTRELENISLQNKVDPTFDETFYTDLGEVAFKLFNKPNFQKVISKIQSNNILDIGCGNGNFIDTFLENNEKSNVVGVERQNIVCERLKEKYKNIENTQIINDDIKNVVLNTKFDVINISYMLFYLSSQEQYSLIKTISSLLAEEGKVIICQYFPDIEDIQMKIAMEDNKWNKIDRYKFKISNAILYAEVLLNDSLSHFNHASRFDEFCDIVKNANLHINEINKADNNYYSFYIILSKIGT